MKRRFFFVFFIALSLIVIADSSPAWTSQASPSKGYSPRIWGLKVIHIETGEPIKMIVAGGRFLITFQFRDPEGDIVTFHYKLTHRRKEGQLLEIPWRQIIFQEGKGPIQRSFYGQIWGMTWIPFRAFDTPGIMLLKIYSEDSQGNKSNEESISLELY